jgi:CheY-like chemotaxis protein
MRRVARWERKSAAPFVVCRIAKAKENDMRMRKDSASTKTPRADSTPQPRKDSARATAPNETRVLSVSNDREDHTVLQRILDGQPFLVSTAMSCEEALEYLGHDRACVVFCDQSMKDGTWRDLLGRASAAGEPPLIVVTSRLADEYLWAEVLNLGGWDVLTKPFQAQEVLHVLNWAWTHKANPVTRVRVAGAA